MFWSQFCGFLMWKRGSPRVCKKVMIVSCSCGSCCDHEPAESLVTTAWLVTRSSPAVAWMSSACIICQASSHIAEPDGVNPLRVNLQAVAGLAKIWQICHYVGGMVLLLAHGIAVCLHERLQRCYIETPDERLSTAIQLDTAGEECNVRVPPEWPQLD